VTDDLAPARTHPQVKTDALNIFVSMKRAHVVYHFLGDFCDWYIEWEARTNFDGR